MAEGSKTEPREEMSLKQLVEQIAHERGLDLTGYKPSTLERRLRKRMFQVGVGTFADYLRVVQQDPPEVNELLNTLLINVTEFFRDPQAWDAFRVEVLPRLLQRLHPGDTFRVWCAGCASGEEAYSLAILIAEFFGPHLPEYDVKIYATDVDEDALNIARRAEYARDRLRRMRPEWREKYFSSNGTLVRVIRDVRRMAIFGRSNLVSDAPISHCDLVVCRNVLIYFDALTQRRIFDHLHYALEPGGVLFLGKAESKLSESDFFQPLIARWRIFQKVEQRGGAEFANAGGGGVQPKQEAKTREQQESASQRARERDILETLKSGVVVLDAADLVTTHNRALLSLWGLAGSLTGRRLQNTDLIIRCPQLAARLESSHRTKDLVTFTCEVKLDGEERMFAITLQPVTNEAGERAGTVISCDDVTHEEKLRGTIGQLEATSEELQSANEELETTNEELQSTNEELETTNEELQSTNEELETTNEELQSLNEELENMNDELEHRTRELNEMSTRYAETLQRMPWPVLLVDSDQHIQVWNRAARRLFGVGETSVVGVELDKLPIQNSLRKALVRRCRTVLEGRKGGVLRRAPGLPPNFDVQFTPVNTVGGVMGVLVMFGGFHLPAGARPAEDKRAARSASKAANRAPKSTRSRGRKKKRR